MADQLPEGISLRAGSIVIDFRFRGQRCRETLKNLAPTKTNIKWAARKRAAILHEIAQGTFDYAHHFPNSKKATLFSGPVRQRKTISELLDSWLTIKKANTQNSTYTSYANKAENHIRPTWGQFYIDEITMTHIEQWMADDLSQLANKTINELLIIMRGLFKRAKADRLIDYNLMDDIDNLNIYIDEPDPFTRDELNRICSTPTHRQIELLTFELACWTGLRLSEWMALAWEDIDLKRRTLTVSRAIVSGHYKAPKTRGSNRTVELMTPALQALEQLKSLTFMQPPTNVAVIQSDNKTYLNESLHFVLLSSITNRPFTSRQRFRESFFEGHLRKAGIRHRGPNQARHTYASQLLTAGMSREWIAQQMGHSSTRTLEQRYAKWITEDAPEMVSLADKLMGFGHMTATENQDDSENG